MSARLPGPLGRISTGQQRWHQCLHYPSSVVWYQLWASLFPSPFCDKPDSRAFPEILWITQYSEVLWCLKWTVLGIHCWQLRALSDTNRCRPHFLTLITLRGYEWCKTLFKVCILHSKLNYLNVIVWQEQIKKHPKRAAIGHISQMLKTVFFFKLEKSLRDKFSHGLRLASCWTHCLGPSWKVKSRLNSGRKIPVISPSCPPLMK